jgi:hypothetical protein
VSRVAGLLVAVLLSAGSAVAQEVQVEVSGGPHYVSESVEVQVTVKDFSEDPQPSVETPAPASGKLRYVGVSPSVTSSMVFDGQRMTRTREVSFVFRFEYRPSQPGSAEIGPFTVSQGATKRTTPPIRINIRKVPSSDRLGVVLELPADPIYVGERVPIALEFRLDRDLQENLGSYTLEVPFFDLSKPFRFIDDSEPKGGTEVTLVTPDGKLTLQGSAQRRGNEVAIRIERLMMPLSEGEIRVPPTTLFVEEGTRWRRDFFGGRTATHSRRLRAIDPGGVFTVKGVPAVGRPPSFAGGVGEGFVLEVSADRTVVQVGEPITLTLTLRGRGNLEAASLPRLDAEGLLPAERFRVPDGELSGRVEDGAKQFSAVVRVLDDAIQEIPALEYAWFDPGREAFEVTRSRPIALSVRSAEVIGAADVFATRDGEPEDPALSPASDAPRTRALALTGADLAIVRDPARLVRSTGGAFGGAWVPVGLYGGGCLALALALLDRRRRAVDPEFLRLRGVVAEVRREVSEAAALAAPEAAAGLARALRRLRAERPEVSAADLDAFLGECDARSYAPPSQRASGALDEAFLARARALVDEIAKEAP